MDESSDTRGPLDEDTRQAIRRIVGDELERYEAAATDPDADPEDRRIGLKLRELRADAPEAGAR